MKIEEVVERAKIMNLDDAEEFTLAGDVNPYDAIGRICFLLANERGSFKIEVANLENRTIHIYRMVN